MNEESSLAKKTIQQERDISLSSVAEKDVTLPSAAEETFPSAAYDELEEISLPDATSVAEISLPDAAVSEAELLCGVKEAEERTILSSDDEFSDYNISSLPALPASSAAPLMTSTPQKIQANVSPMPSLSTSNNEDSLNVLDESDNNRQWQLSSVLNFSGCGTKCATSIHGLCNHDILRAHSFFENRSRQEQNDYIIQFLVTNCPYDEYGDRNIKNMNFTIQGKAVCMKLWLEILSLSTSRFYRLRQQFITFGGLTSIAKARRSLAPRTLECIAWMEHYFERMGDKRPDKADAVYLPTCLTEKKLHEIYIEDVYQGDKTKAICRSTFNSLFNTNFKHVTIPKVSMYKCKIFKCHKVIR